MPHFSKGRQAAALIALCLLPVLGAFFVSVGLVATYEFVHLMAVEQFLGSGSLATDFGRASPNQPGATLLAAPLYALLGVRGLVLLNAGAGAGVLYITWRLGCRLYRDAAVAFGGTVLLMLGTFFFACAWAIWPHMVTVFFALAAFFLALDAVRREERFVVMRAAVLSGFLAGLGMSIQSEAILILPVIGLCILIFARWPIWALFGVCYGLAPVAAALAYAQSRTFETFNFLSNGPLGGVDVASHLGTLAIMVAIGLGLYAARFVQWTQTRIWIAMGGVVALLAVAFLLPPHDTTLRSIAVGYVTLFVGNNTHRTALFHSLPWMGVLGALLFSPWRSEQRRSHAILLILVLFWSLPLVALGRQGDDLVSLGYILPLLPPLAVLGAAIIVDLVRQSGEPILRLLVVYVIVASLALVGLSVGVVSLDQGPFWLPFILFAIVFVSVAVATTEATATAPSRRIAVYVICVALGVSTAGTLDGDVIQSQTVRATAEAVPTQADVGSQAD